DKVATAPHGCVPSGRHAQACNGADRQANCDRLPAPEGNYFWRVVTISATFTSRSPIVLKMFTTIRLSFSITTSSRPFTFWAVSGQNSSLTHSKRVPVESQVTRPLEMVPHSPHAFTQVNFFWPAS